MRLSAIFLVFMPLLLSAVPAFPATAPGPEQPHGKKLIEYGWDVPDAAYIRQHITKMEKLPFDGLVFRLGGWPQTGNVLSGKPWDEKSLQPLFDDCRQIHWGKFTDNFIIMLAASSIDWFSDADWQAVTHNVDLLAKAANFAHCKGLCFDPEPYGKSPWRYGDQAHAGQKSFDEYQSEVRKRGAQFMQAIQQEMPDAVILTFFQLSLFGNVMDAPAVRRDQMLSTHGYGLLPAFLNGMLDAADLGIRITDGNEPSYYYKSPLQYYEEFHMVRQRALALVDPANVAKYQTQVQVGQALYVDYVFGLGTWATRSSPAPALSADERARWFEADTYDALTTSDEYVWLYSEKMNWWKNQDLPPGLEKAVESARAKVADHRPLGFDMTDTLKAADQRKKTALDAGRVQRTAEIPHLRPGQSPPRIDGRLDDPAWKDSATLAAFLPYVMKGN